MRLYFHKQGQGPPLIILHGLFGSSDNWMPIARKLSGQFEVFAVDQRNHGRSPHSAEMNFQVMADDLAELLRDHHLDQAHVLGHSMGGKTAMQFALSHPTKVGKLVIADMAPRVYPPGHLHIYKKLLSLDLAKFQHRTELSDALAAEIPSLALRLFLLKMIGRNPDGTLFWQAGVQNLHANSDRLRAALPEAPPFAGPTLFIRGEKSDYVRDEDEPVIRGIFSNAAFRTIPGAGHWLHADAPEVFCQEVLTFLQS